jgi:hypothetical protein
VDSPWRMGTLRLRAPAADPNGMSVNDFVLVQGLRDTRETLEGWSSGHWRVLGEWARASLLISIALLAAIYAVARLSQPDPTPLAIPGVTVPADAGDVLFVLYRNSLVLALHALACVAGFIAGSSLPISAAKRSGLSRWIHEKAGPLAIAFVVGATTFSLATQAYILGTGTSSFAAQIGTSPGRLLLTLLPHALPELVALFLPLAAWLMASRRNEWERLLAATFVTVAVAAPVLIVSALVETYLSPELILSLAR